MTLRGVKRHVVIAGPMPPPVTGFSYITQEMTKILSSHYAVDIIDLSPHRTKGGIGYHFHRLFLTLKGIIPLLRRCRIAARVFYVACEGNLGLIYTILLCFTARLLGYATFIHHHSFGYIEHRSILMNLLIKITGSAATHVFLCEDMAKCFAQRYQVPIKAIILPNSAFVNPAPTAPVIKTSEKPLVIGLLSNLNHDKGLGLFLEVLREALAQNMHITAILAGPPQSDIEKDVIETACIEFGAKLDYSGPLYGPTKDDFFRAIDVFVFPTRYVNEAQPTVIFEALAHGVPILSYDRGCICSQVSHFGAVQKRDEEFISFALEWLQTQISTRETFTQLTLDTHASYVQAHTSAQQKATELFNTPAVRFSPKNSATLS